MGYIYGMKRWRGVGILVHYLFCRSGKEDHEMRQSRILKALLISCSLTFALSCFAGPDQAQARRGGIDDNRSEFYGVVQSLPEKGLRGVWVIAGRTIRADAGTEFDQVEGKLAVGRCVKVHIRNGRVHEIDSEPMRNCR
jgi:hypothetical protein